MPLASVLSNGNTIQPRHLQQSMIKARARLRKGLLTRNILAIFIRISIV
jgi:hypothetical protein